MGDKIYVNVIIPIPISSDITYVVPDNYIDSLEIGKRVLVPFGNTKSRIGIIKELLYEFNSEFELKEIIKVLDDQPIINQNHIDFWTWISNYYVSPIGMVMKMATLSSLLKEEDIDFNLENCINRVYRNNNILSDHQQNAYIDVINNFKKN